MSGGTVDECVTSVTDESKLDLAWVVAEVVLVDVLEEALVVASEDASVVEVIFQDVLVQTVQLFNCVLCNYEAVVVEYLFAAVVDHLSLHILCE